MAVSSEESENLMEYYSKTPPGRQGESHISLTPLSAIEPRVANVRSYPRCWFQILLLTAVGLVGKERLAVGG
jgi:hypothetical protein